MISHSVCTQNILYCLIVKIFVWSDIFKKGNLIEKIRTPDPSIAYLYFTKILS